MLHVSSQMYFLAYRQIKMLSSPLNCNQAQLTVNK
jgi:hypothetical protein